MSISRSTRMSTWTRNQCLTIPWLQNTDTGNKQLSWNLPVCITGFYIFRSFKYWIDNNDDSSGNNDRRNDRLLSHKSLHWHAQFWISSKYILFSAMIDSVISSIWLETELKEMMHFMIWYGWDFISHCRTFGTIIRYRRSSVTIPKDEDIVVEFNPF